MKEQSDLRIVGAVTGLALLAAACSQGSDGGPSEPPDEQKSNGQRAGHDVALATTFPGSDGRRFAAGRGALDAATPVDVALPEVPVWVVGIPGSDPAEWWVALESGAVVAVAGPGSVAEVGSIPAGTPLAIGLDESGRPSLIKPSDRSASPASSPLIFETGTRALVDASGSLVIERSGTAATLVHDVPLDSRIVASGASLFVVAGATDRYPHGVLGDEIEGSLLVNVDLESATATAIVELEGDLVFEGTVPMLVDLDGDGVREIVLTVSDRDVGARIVSYDSTGVEIAAGPEIGRGGRWRHQVAAGPFGPGGETEIVVVKTPHIGGVVEFYRLAGGELQIVAEVAGFSSHRFGSPNLDMALAADADGDGSIEIVVPTDPLTALGGIRRTADGVEVAWLVDIGGSMVTNLATARSEDGTLSFAVGRSDAVLRIWP